MKESYTGDKSSCLFFGGLPRRFFSGAFISEISLLQEIETCFYSTVHMILSKLSCPMSLSLPELGGRLIDGFLFIQASAVEVPVKGTVSILTQRLDPQAVCFQALREKVKNKKMTLQSKNKKNLKD